MLNSFIINTHSHVNTLKKTPIDEALENCKKDNIAIIVPSSNSQDIFDVDKFVKEHSGVYGYVGVFPEDVKTFGDKTLFDMEGIIKNNPKIVGIGEVGLDYYWDKTFVDLQKEVFIKQIYFANQMNLPLNIHCRDAYFETLEILKKYNKNSKVIMHCFSGSWEFAKECIKLGAYISLGGVVTFKNAHQVKEVAKNVPLENLLLETDDPYLTPEPYRGTENQPDYVKYVAQRIADLKEISIQEVAQASTRNANEIFNFA